jgi:hypothetical protein
MGRSVWATGPRKRVFMTTEMKVLAQERRFFKALLDANVTELDEILADDFIIVDVLSGSEVPKVGLLAAVASSQVKFEAIDVLESRVRAYRGAAVVNGRTQMRGRFGQMPSASSRYTHVYIESEGRWRLVSAQGTQIAAESASASS